MIKVSFIAPTNLINPYGNRGDFHLALSHLLPNLGEESNAYTEALTSSGLPIYLDNGLFENGVAEPMETLLKKAQQLRAEYVFAPDVLFNREKTEENLYKFIQLRNQIPEGEYRPKIAAVVQANDPEDFLASYTTFVYNKDVDLIGLSILSVPESFKKKAKTNDIATCRKVCLQDLQKLPEHKDTHMLGAGSSYKDVYFAARECPWVVSHDSSSAIWNGVDYRPIGVITLEIKGGKTPRHVDFNFNKSLTKEQKDIINGNIATVLDITEH